MSRMSEVLFVYGTLQRQGAAHRLLVGQATYLGSAWLQGRLYEAGGYPGVVLSDNPRERVHGELYRMYQSDILLAQLDDYEEIGPQYPHPHEYWRMQVSVRTFRQKPYTAWTYIYAHCTNNLARIPCGRWLS